MNPLSEAFHCGKFYVSDLLNMNNRVCEFGARNWKTLDGG